MLGSNTLNNHKQVCNGRPVVPGTRLEISLILRLLAEGNKKSDIVKLYPWITKKDITAALWEAANICDKVRSF